MGLTKDPPGAEEEKEHCLEANGDRKSVAMEIGSFSLEDEKRSAATIAKVSNLGDFMQFGYYSVFIIILYEMLLLPQMFNLTFMVYAGFAPKVVACGNETLRQLSSAESCAEMYRLVNASGCKPKFEVQFESVAYEFGYYCDTIVEVKKSISIQLFGVLLGALVFGQLSDLFGRKRVMLFTHVGMFVLGYTASRYSHSLFEFTFIQLASMFFVGGHNTIMHVFLLENMPKRHRIIVLTALSYSPNYIIFAAVAYVAYEWRTLLCINSFLNVPAFFVLLMAFESPRWLIQRGELQRARSTLLKIERINGTDTMDRVKIIDDIIQLEVKMNETKKRNRKYYLYHLFYTSTMSRHIMVISFALMSTSMLAYALLFNMEHLSGSIYLNSALFGLFRYSMNLSVGSLDYFVPRVGRKLVFNGALTFILVMLATVFVCKIMDWDSPLVLRVTTLSAAAMCSQLFMINAVVTSELFPTAVRNLATSFVQMWNRTGAIIAPHVFYLALSWAPLPFLLMFVLMSANMALFSTMIPETKNSPMVDHMPDRSERIFSSIGSRKNLMRMDIEPSSAKLTEDC